MGWSFGTVVAQTLAIQHPTLIRRLVLAAPALGDGTAKGNNVSPPAGYTCDASEGHWIAFPFTEKGCAAAVTYVRAIHTYPDYSFETNTDAVSTSEDNNLTLWIDGKVKEGHQGRQNHRAGTRRRRNPGRDPAHA